MSEKRKTHAVLVRLSASDYAIVERIAKHKAMTVPDVLRAGIDHLDALMREARP